MASDAERKAYSRGYYRGRHGSMPEYEPLEPLGDDRLEVAVAALRRANYLVSNGLAVGYFDGDDHNEWVELADGVRSALRSIREWQESGLEAPMASELTTSDPLSIYEETGHIEEIDLSACSYDELLDLKTLVERDIAEIKAQIGAAMARSHDGDYVDPDWFQRAKSARRFKGWMHQQVNRALSRAKVRRKERRRLEGEEEGRRFKVGLMRAMDVLLDPETRDEIVAMATEYAESEADDGP